MEKIDYAYVATLDGTPVAVGHNIEDIEKILNEFTGASKGLSKKIKFYYFESKYPSINELEGCFHYQDKDSQSEDVYKVYSTQYLQKN